MNDPEVAQLLALIGTVDDTGALRSLRDRIQEELERKLPNTSVEQFYSDLNEVHDAIVSRAVHLAEQEMARTGNGFPPVPYAYLLFGSGGRSEQTLSSDQDSAMLYEIPDNADNREQVEAYFQAFARLVVDILKTAGYPPCEGNVISTNPEWCESLSEFKRKLNRWFEEGHWEVVRYLLIVADARMVAGEERLIQELKDSFYRDTLEKPLIVRRMLDNTMKHKVLIGVFGQLLKERYGEDAGSLDVKYGAYIPMVNAVRLMAIQAGIRETSTLERLKKLKEQNRLPEEADKYAAAFRLFLKLRLLTMERNEGGMYKNNGKIAGDRLTAELRRDIKEALKAGKKLQRLVARQTASKLM
ncbi:DUF294 nucleotidyltransferase-like domain-containing protein [Paenibacillus tarimensis]|uniref:DUF294 nucleotidyltransferase-like domain-containing protein n=1 Tax=Paenibacillus tarimensis TaxID=416012 RepID=UPI001F267839|nr:DUF294 nucleotidyltransferase-like domain-containing protein [Paenibacillus tarimensis]MCF2943234.1 DUF294 nucleotidyltransferase-like domain-containing protein [Paenibacillus tarimensis]